VSGIEERDGGAVNTRDVRILTAITVARIVLVPAIMALVLVGDERRYAYVAAAVVFVIAALTDFVDGYLARRWSLTTTLGSFLDTTADKLLVSGALIALVAVERVSPWVVVIIVSRELAVLALRGMVAAEGRLMKPSIWGKLKANVQFVAVAMAMARAHWELGGLHPDEWAMLIAAVITILSAVEYFNRFGAALTPASPEE
jgi:CDP-diacylglycerol--glycerol-3-phosphate 3-phosphatidyltransferase